MSFYRQTVVVLVNKLVMWHHGRAHLLFNLRGQGIIAPLEAPHLLRGVREERLERRWPGERGGVGRRGRRSSKMRRRGVKEGWVESGHKTM